MKNTTTNPITARPRFLPKTGEGSGVVELPVVTLPPNAVTELNLSSLISAAAVRPDLDSVAVQIINSGEKGSLIGAANFTDNLTGVDYDIPLRDSGSPTRAAGGYPIRLDGDYSTTLSLTNTGSEAGKFTLQINYAGGIYALFPQQVAAGATVLFDFRQLRDWQTPDSSGRVLPVDLTIGQIRWSQTGGTATTLIGRSEIVSKTDKVSSSYSCGICCRNSYESGRLTPDQVFEFLGGSDQISAKQKDRDCYGNYFAEYTVSNANWTSSDYSIVDVSYNGMATAVGVGDVMITATWDAEFSFDNGSDTCDVYPVIAAPTGEMVVKPKIDSISPDRSVVSRTVDVTINGKGFAAGADVQVSGSGVTVSDITVVSSTKITAKFAIAANATQGNRKVTVTVNNQTSGQKDFLVQVPAKLEVIADTGNVGVPNCSPTVRRQVTYKLIDEDNKEIRQAVEIIEDLSNVSANSCNNGLPMAPSCAATDPPPQQGQAYRFTDSISVNFSCASPVALQSCQSNSSCGYTYTQKWKTCGNDGSVQLFNVSGATLCNQIKLNNSTQFSVGTRPPN